MIVVNLRTSLDQPEKETFLEEHSKMTSLAVTKISSEWIAGYLSRFSRGTKSVGPPLKDADRTSPKEMILLDNNNVSISLPPASPCNSVVI